MSITNRMKELNLKLANKPIIDGLLSDYQTLIEHVASGINLTVEEYFDLLDSRSLLQGILDDTGIQDMQGTAELRRLVSEFDAVLRPMLIDNAPIGRLDDFWWNQTLPKRARKVFVQDVEYQFGITLELIE